LEAVAPSDVGDIEGLLGLDGRARRAALHIAERLEP